MKSKQTYLARNFLLLLRAPSTSAECDWNPNRESNELGGEEHLQVHTKQHRSANQCEGEARESDRNDKNDRAGAPWKIQISLLHDQENVYENYCYLIGNYVNICIFFISLISTNQGETFFNIYICFFVLIQELGLLDLLQLSTQ